MNLFIGVILDGFDAASASDHDVITQEDFARFANHWAQFDPRATCLISVQASRSEMKNKCVATAPQKQLSLLTKHGVVLSSPHNRYNN